MTGKIFPPLRAGLKGFSQLIGCLKQQYLNGVFTVFDGIFRFVCFSFLKLSTDFWKYGNETNVSGKIFPFLNNITD